MEGECFGEQVLTHTPHLDCELSVPGAAVGVAGTKKGDGVVAFLNDEHTDHLLVAVHDEIPTKLVRIFSHLYQLLPTHARQVTTAGPDHDWDRPEVGSEGVAAPVDVSRDLSDKVGRVGLTG